MKWLIYAICAVLAYFIGNIQTGVILSNTVFKSDIRSMGSGNSGATNMMRMFGLKSGILTFLGDVIKTVLAIALAWIIGGKENGVICGYIAALATVIGHDFPVLFGFHGGKGIASTVALMWMLTPVPEALITALIGIALIALTRIMSLSVLIALACYLVMIIFMHTADIPLIVLAALLFVIALIRHAENIKRIIHGNERKLTFSKKGEKQKETEAKQ